MQEHLFKYCNSMRRKGFLVITHFLDIKLSTLSDQNPKVLNGKYRFACLGYILGYWLDEDRLWTKNLETIHSNFFFMYLLQLLYNIYLYIACFILGRVTRLWLAIVLKLKSSGPWNNLFRCSLIFPLQPSLSSLNLIYFRRF